MTRWLVTGGCGFIGRNLIARLLEEPGHAIRVLDNLKIGSKGDLLVVADRRASNGGGVAIDFVRGDILDAELVAACARDCDVFVHLAGNTGVEPSVRDPRADCVANVIGTLNCLEAARHGSVTRFIFASSGAPLGEVEPPIHEQKAPRPSSPYGASKLAGEGYCSAYYRSFGLETVALRFGNVYGPGSSHKNSVVAAFIRSALAGKPLEINGDGRQSRDFIFAGDLVRAIIKAATVPGIGGEVFQIATARETTILELAELLVRCLQERGVGRVALIHGPVRAGDIRRNFSDSSKAATMLGWRAEIPLAEGLGHVVDWFIHRADGPAGAATFAGSPPARAGRPDAVRRAAHRCECDDLA